MKKSILFVLLFVTVIAKSQDCLTNSVTITSNLSSSRVCAGVLVTFTATPTNGGIYPRYQWKINGTDIAGATSATYSTNTLSNNDIISVSMISNNYNDIAIGRQYWKSQNLDVTTYRNGDIIPKVTSASTWQNLTTGAWCWYNNDSARYAAIYGKLYNWYAVNDSRGLAPENYHVPNQNDWDTLTNYLGGLSVSGGKLKEVGIVNWKYPNSFATNSSGFTALPGGDRNTSGDFGNLGYTGAWWSKDQSSSTDGYIRVQWHYNNNTNSGGWNKKNGASVRIIRDSTAPITCYTNNPALSNSITVSVDPMPSVTWNSTAAVCKGTTSTVLNYTNALNAPNQYSIDWSAAANTAGLSDVSWTNLSGGNVTINNITNTVGNYTASILVRNTTTGCVSNSFIGSTGSLCGTANEVGSGFVTLTAPTGGTFTAVSFASYGNPNGSCGNFTLGDCSAPTSVSVVQTAFVGRSTGTVYASNAVFGDPCGIQKRLYISLDYTIPFLLTVNDLPSIAPTSTVCTGSTIQLTGIGTPASVNPWTSTLPSKASVNSTGLVSGIAAGTAPIVFTDINGCTATYNLTVNAYLPASVVITSSATNNTVCGNSSVTFTATPTNGGLYPSYQWKLNGNNVGTNSTTYTNPSVSNNDIITVVMTSADNNDVVIGGQSWTSKNLDVSKYKNGDAIPKVTDAYTWQNLTTGAWCWYNNDSATYAATYGRIYNWYAVNDVRGLAPANYHIPSNAEWTRLTSYLGGLPVSGGKLKEVGTSHWQSPNTSATNSSGFTALPGGDRNTNADFGNIGSAGSWWTSSAYSSSEAYVFVQWYYDNNTNNGYWNKRVGTTVRCLRDSTAPNPCYSNSPATSNAITMIVNPVPAVTWNTANSCTGSSSTIATFTNAIGSPNQYSIDWNAAANTAGLNDVSWTNMSGNSITLNNVTATLGSYYATVFVRNTTTGCVSNSLTKGTICGTGQESLNTLVTLTAPYNQVFTAIKFASYGLPTGTCGGFVYGTCNASNSMTIVQNAFVGRNTNSILTNNSVFGDPCSYEDKKLFIEAEYIIPTFNLVVNPAVIPDKPVVPTGIVNVCKYVGNDSILTYTVPPVTNAISYTWTIPPYVNLISGQGTNSIRVSFANGFINPGTPNKQIRVKANGICGSSLPSVFYLAAQFPVTPLTIVASTTNVCASLGTNVQIYYTIPKVAPASSYIWTAQNGTTNITHVNDGENDTIVGVTFASNFTSGNITVQALNACGLSGSRSYLVTLNMPSQPSLISGSTNACEYIGDGGQTATYSVSADVFIDNYSWILPSGATNISGQGTNSISFKYPAGFTGGTISVTGTNGCGTSMTRTLSIDRLSPMTPGNIDVINTQLCPSREFTYSLATMPGNATSAFWTVPAGATIVNGQGTRSITVSYANSVVDGYVTVKGISNCATSATRFLIIKLPSCPANPSPEYTKGVMSTTPTAMEVKVFPNPTTSSFHLQVTTSGSKSVIQARVMDLQGRLMKVMQINPNENISLGAEFKSGVYMLEVLNGTEKKVVRVVKY